MVTYSAVQLSTDTIYNAFLFTDTSAVDNTRGLVFNQHISNDITDVRSCHRHHCLMFTGLFHYFTPEVKLSPTRKSSSFVYERLKPDRTNPVQASTDFTVNTDSELTDKPCSSYNTRSLHNGDMDRQIVEQNECKDREIAPVEEYHDGRKKISWKDWLKEPQFYQVNVPFAKWILSCLCLEPQKLTYAR